MKLYINDSFEIKEEYQGNHVPGLVILASSESPLAAESTVGRTLVITTTSGIRSFIVSEAKQHGQQVSFFLPHLVLGDVLPGSPLHLEIPPTLDASPP